MRFVRLGSVEDARPGKKFFERGGDLLVEHGVGVGEKDGGVRETAVVGGNPIEIAFAVSSETESFAPALSAEVDCVFLAFEIEREESFNPFRWILRLQRILGVGGGTANLDLFGQDRGVVVVDCEKTLWEVRADSLLDLGGIWINKAAAERVAGGLELLGRLSIAELMHEAARADDGHEQHEGDNERAEGFDKQRLHYLMILELKVRRSDRIVSGWIQSARREFSGQRRNYVSLAEVVAFEE